jgi:amino acid permease
MPMTFNRSLGWGFVLALAITAVTLIVGFMVGGGFEIPGVVEMSSSSGGGRQETEFFFNPLAPLLLAVILGLGIWAVGRARSSHED